jgi:hypothetical protein
MARLVSAGKLLTHSSLRITRAGDDIRVALGHANASESQTWQHAACGTTVPAHGTGGPLPMDLLQG